MTFYRLPRSKVAHGVQGGLILSSRPLRAEIGEVRPWGVKIPNMEAIVARTEKKERVPILIRRQKLSPVH